MILLTLFQLTILFEVREITFGQGLSNIYVCNVQFCFVFKVLFFVIWAFPNWANQGIASDDATTNGKLLIPEAKNGSCHAQGNKLAK